MSAHPTRVDIREPNLYGERHTYGNRMAEAVRCYPGEWDVFCYLDGRMLADPPRRLRASEAKARARLFVLGRAKV